MRLDTDRQVASNRRLAGLEEAACNLQQHAHSPGGHQKKQEESHTFLIQQG